MAAAIAASAWAMLYESHVRDSVKLSFCALTLSGALTCKLRIWFVPTSQSQVISPGQACALIKLVPPPVVRAANCARMASMALCSEVSAAVRSLELAKGPADCRAKISES